MDIRITEDTIDRCQATYAARGAAAYALSKLHPVFSRGAQDNLAQRQPTNATNESSSSETTPKLPPILRELPMFKNLLPKGNNTQNATKSPTSNPPMTSYTNKEQSEFWWPDPVPYTLTIANTRSEVLISCENGKLNINLVSPQILENFFLQKGLSVVQSQVIVDSIQDWIDADDNTRLNGAESQYYLSLTPPYKCKNGPLETVEELLLVRGVTHELFNKIRGDLTVLGNDARININFASIDVLSSVPGISRSLAQQVIDKRNNLGRFQSLDQIRDLVGLGFEQIKKYITTQDGQFYSIQAGPSPSRPSIVMTVTHGKVIRVQYY